jgi:hypothetical protein
MVLFMTNMIKATEKGYHQMNQALKQRVEEKEVSRHAAQV